MWVAAAGIAGCLSSWWCISKLLNTTFASAGSYPGAMGRIFSWPGVIETIGSGDDLKRAICVSVCGGLCSLLFGCGACMAARRREFLPLAMLSGVVLGHLYGFAAGRAGTMFSRFCDACWPVAADGHPVDVGQWLIRWSIVIHGATWAIVAISVGICSGYGWGSARAMRRACGGAITGSIAGTLLYILAGALLFPLDQTDWAIPTGHGNQALWIGMPVCGMAAGLIRNGKRLATCA